jgi:arylsulfatase A-like enzyme
VGVAILTVVGTASVIAPAHAAQDAGRKNVVIILTDDQRWDKVTPQYMPNVSQAFNGSFYSQGIVPNSLCCPSRTSVLTGDYSHTTGVWNNAGDHGGFDVFGGALNPTADDHTIAVDFDQAGYRTAMIGKYLNHYEPNVERYVPPGWDRWFALRTGSYYDYWASVRRHRNLPVRNRYFGHKQEQDYATNVIRDQALDFIDDAGSRPFFLYLSWTAPHGPAIPDPNDLGRFAGEQDYQFNDDTNDGSSVLEAAYGTDRATARVLAALPSDTIVVFMSDNGYLWGEHGLTGKMQPYEEATRVPLAIKSLDGSWSPAAGHDDIIANVDLRPTLTRAAGIGAPLVPVDGIDLGAGYTPRDEIVLEHMNDAYSYCGVRTNGWMYARYNDGRELLFDLSTDYAENDNLANDPASADKLAALKAQAVELCSPKPPGYTWQAP